MLSLVVMILLFLGAIGAVVWTRKLKKEKAAAHQKARDAAANGQRVKLSYFDPWYGRGVAIFLGILLVLVFWLTCTVSVGTKDIAVMTSYGHVDYHLGPGLSLKAPWEKANIIDAAIQTDNYGTQTPGSNDGAGINTGCLQIRIAFSQTVCGHVSIKWRIRPAGADALFQNYRTFNNIRDALVTQDFQTALNQQFSSFNPLNTVGTIDSNGNEAPPTQPAAVSYGAKIAAQLRREIGSRIEVLTVFTPFLRYDDATQKRLNQLQQQVALTRIAKQEIATNTAQNTANNKIKTSVTTGVLVQQCLTLMEQVQKGGGPWPNPGFSCWPGGSSVGGVIVNTNQTPTTPKK